MLYGTKRNDGSTPYYLPRNGISTYKWIIENANEKSAKAKSKGYI